MERDSNGDWPPWLSTVKSCAIFGLPLLLVREHPWFALCAWLFVVMVYLLMVVRVGTARIEAAVISFMLACTLAGVIHAVHRSQEVQEVQAQVERRKRILQNCRNAEIKRYCQNIDSEECINHCVASTRDPNGP